MSVSHNSIPLCELDSHADTCAFGKHCTVLETYNHTLSVSGFDKSLGSLSNVKVAKVAVAFDCQLTMKSYILIFDQVLYIPSMEHNLLCVDQLRDNDLIVNDVPLQRLKPQERNSRSHSIIDKVSGLHIPMEFSKPISSFPCRKPDLTEIYDDINHLQVQMTSPVPWEPYDAESSRVEQSLRRQHQGDTAIHRIYSLKTSDRTYKSVCHESLPTSLEGKVHCTMAGVKTDGKSHLIQPDHLARRWRISLECARRTLQKTTQRAVRDWTNVTGSRRFRPTQFQLEYPRLRADFWADVKQGPCVSIEGNKYVAVYAAACQWARGYGLKSESDVSGSLKNLFRDVGFPRVLRPDDAESLTGGEFKRVANKAQVPIHPSEPYHPDQNLAEDCIREASRMYVRFMTSRGIPKAFWDRVFIYCLELRSHMVLGHSRQDGECGATVITGNTSDISHLADFSIYDWCWALSPTSSTQENKQLCRWLGPSFSVGGSLCYACASARGRILHRSSVIPLNIEERNSDDVKTMKRRFTDELHNRLKNSDPIAVDSELFSTDAEADAKYIRPLNAKDDTPQFERYEDDHMEPFIEAPSEEDQQQEFDKYVGVKVRKNEDGIDYFGVVKGRKRRADGTMVGTYNERSVLDTAIYEIEWHDYAGKKSGTAAYRANEVIEAMLMNVDDEGNSMLHIREFVNHEKENSALHADDGHIVVNGKRVPRRTTKGWKMCAEVQGGETEWMDLKIAKEAYPIQVAEYAVANKLVSEPAFAWWVPYTLRKRDRVLKIVKRRALTRRKKEKFGLELPASGPKGVHRAIEIDAETGTNHWSDAMNKEVKTVLPALRILEENESVPPGYTLIELMTVFDVKMDLTRKARICARGDQTDPPLSVTYASVVTRESIRLGFLLASLNRVDILSADIAGAYLNAKCAEKIYTVLGEEFGDLKGRTAIVVKALYGLKSSAFAWRSTLSKTLKEEMEFVQCRGDMDVWRKPAVKKNGEKYYEYIFVYVDDLMAVSENPRAILNKLGSHYLLKPDSIAEPTTFLGATISKRFLDDSDDYPTWTIGSSKYLVEALRVVKSRINDSKYNLSLKSKVSATLPSGYKPELDSTNFVDDETGIFYMQLIGILRWLVELGRIDVCAEVSMMSAYNAMPRVGHFHAVLHLFAYLQTNANKEIAMDSKYQDHLPHLEKAEWAEFYPWAKDELPPDMPKALGRAVKFLMFVDASHASNLVTRQSRTGVIIYVNRAPILWYSKKQNSVETSSFGSEFAALKTGVELFEGLRYKLQMMGVPIDGYCHTCVDNNSVVMNTSRPESTLKKKSNSVAYHYVRSKCAADLIRITWEGTKTNVADMLTKIHSGPERKRIADMVMYECKLLSELKAEIKAMCVRFFLRPE